MEQSGEYRTCFGEKKPRGHEDTDFLAPPGAFLLLLLAPDLHRTSRHGPLDNLLKNVKLKGDRGRYQKSLVSDFG